MTLIQVRQFIWAKEVGRSWEFETIEKAEQELGWFFVHNCCEFKEIK